MPLSSCFLIAELPSITLLKLCSAVLPSGLNIAWLIVYTGSTSKFFNGIAPSDASFNNKNPYMRYEVSNVIRTGGYYFPFFHFFIFPGKAFMILLKEAAQ